MSISIESQAAAYERSVRSVVRKNLLEGGRRFRARMVAERIGGHDIGAVLDVVSGKLKRSFRYKVAETTTGFTLDAEIGGGNADYAKDHEDLGRLEFENTFKQEADSMLRTIETDIRFLTSYFEERSLTLVSAGDAIQDAEDFAGNDERRAILREGKEHFRAKREAAKLRRMMKWHSMTKGA